MEKKWQTVLRIPNVEVVHAHAVDEKDEKAIMLDIGRDSDNFDKERIARVLRMYVWRFPCDGYCQGMHMMAKPLVAVLKSDNDVVWGMSRIVAEVRTLLPSVSQEKWEVFYEKWEAWFLMFSGEMADEEHVMALRWGVFRLAPSATAEDLVVLWDAMLEYPPMLRGVYTAAIAAAAVRRDLRHLQYDARVAAKLRFEKVAGLVKVAKRTMEVYKNMYV